MVTDFAKAAAVNSDTCSLSFTTIWLLCCRDQLHADFLTVSILQAKQNKTRFKLLKINIKVNGNKSHKLQTVK